MSIFNRTKTIRNAAGVEIATPPPARPIVTPGNTTIHNHGIAWWQIIGISFFCIIVSVILGWHGLVFLFREMGSRTPEKDTAFWLVMIPVLFLASWVLKWLLLALLDSWRGWDLEIEQERSQQARDNLLAAQTALDPGRMNESDFEFARVILAVMMIAYDWLETKKLQQFPGRARPWSKAETLATAKKIGVNISQDKALSVAKWLSTEGIITAPDLGQIASAYPTLSSVRAHLDNKFGKAIVVVSPALRDNRGFRFIE